MTYLSVPSDDWVYIARAASEALREAFRLCFWISSMLSCEWTIVFVFLPYMNWSDSDVNRSVTSVSVWLIDVNASIFAKGFHLILLMAARRTALSDVNCCNAPTAPPVRMIETRSPG